MHRQFAGHEIGFGGQNIAVLPNANDFAGLLELAQSLSDVYALPPLRVERLRDLVPVTRPVVGRAQQDKNLFSNCAAVLGHIDEMILQDVDLTIEFEV